MEGLSDLAIRLFAHYESTGDIAALNNAIFTTEQCLINTHTSHPDRPRILMNLGIYLGSRHERFRSIDDLSRAVKVSRQALSCILDGDPDQSKILSQLGRWLARRSEDFGTDDLAEAIEVTEVALALTAREDRWYAIILTNLANMLGQRFSDDGNMSDINRAIDCSREAVSITSTLNPLRTHMLHSLGSRLGTRYKHNNDLNDLDEAIEKTDESVQSSPVTEISRPNKLSSLAKWLGLRFDRTGATDDLDRSIQTASMAVHSFPAGHPDRIGCLQTLGNKFGSRFERSGSVDDLHQAIKLIDEAVKLYSIGNPGVPNALSNLGLWLGSRFESTGSVDDLNRAIDVTDEAVMATPSDHVDYALRLNNLGRWLARRFERIGAINDLDRAIEATMQSVLSTPFKHTERSPRLSNLGNWYGLRYQRLQNPDDLDCAIEFLDMAEEETPIDHSWRPWWLNNLSIWLVDRYELHGDGNIDDLNRAISIGEIAIDLTPIEHSARSRLLNSLGNNLRSKYTASHSVEDMKRSIEVLQMAVDETDPANANRAGILLNLGYSYNELYEKSAFSSRLDIEQALASHESGWRCVNAPAMIRISNAQQAAVIHASMSHWEESRALLEGALELIPVLSPWSLQNSDKQFLMKRIVGMATMAAAMALNASKEPHEALKLLELGRGVIAGLLLEIRTDISHLKKQYPRLAQEFIDVRNELDSPTVTEPVAAPGTSTFVGERDNKLRAAEKRYPILLDEIRSKPGFENFALPPHADELKIAAQSGPIVVINVSNYRCDAFIVRLDRPVEALRLSKLRLQDVKSHVKTLKTANTYGMHKILEWLWDAAASPILDALGFTKPASGHDWPHVWWILTGSFSKLPLHAAGRHFKGSTETVLDRVMSSYSPSIRALLYARRQKIGNFAPKTKENAVLVTVPGSGLPFAKDEVQILEQLCPSLDLNPIKPAADREQIISQLRSCKIFHFAGHGRSNPLEPSESCLVLSGKNNAVSVADLRDCRLQETSPFLAYLSACSTKVNEVDQLVDEEIHLVSACQLAGFRHVIGTLWEVSDEHCAEVARDLYTAMKAGITDDAVCRGLHQAIRALRDKDLVMTLTEEEIHSRDDMARQSTWGVSKVPSQLCGPHLWAAYIHSGP